MQRFLDGDRGLRFSGRDGYGIGLRPVETPGNNSNWDNHFNTGDVFTLASGLHGDALCAGLRIENDCVLFENGVQRLSVSASVLPR